ncbi:hypothetical protein AAG906_016407 [Vitis piasezkii]
MFPSKQKSIKSLFSTEGMKKVGKTISKFFLFNVIPFNVTDSGPSYQSMIDTIAEAGPGIKSHTKLEMHIWRRRCKSLRSMIYHSSVDTTNIPKTIDYIFSLMDKVVEEVREENWNHLFWSPCAAHCIELMLEDIASMKQIKETLDQAKMITRFIYNSLKVVNLMKVFTKDRDLLRPGITRFAIEFISVESLIRYETDLKRMCTTNEWCEFNKDRSRKREVQTIMEPLVKVLKLVDQDKKPTLSIIYEAMDRYWEAIDKRWENQLHRHLHAADEWIREGKKPILSSDNLDWLDKGLPTNEEWAVGGMVALVGAIEELVALVRRDIQILEHELLTHMDMINLLVVVALFIEVLDTINMVLMPNRLQNHIFLIMDHQANHLTQHIRVMNNSFNHILTTGIATPIYILSED